MAKNTFVTLLVFFSIFVLADIITTTWLIQNDPSGISNEANPFGTMLYLKYGILGLFIGKMVFFLPFSIMVITAETKYYRSKWFCKASEIIVLGLIAYSLVIFLNNFTAIIVLSALKGWLFLSQLLSTIKFLIIVFSMSLEIIILELRGLKSHVQRVETVVGSLLIVVPLLLFDRLYIFLADNPYLLIAYIASLLVMLGIASYVTDEIIQTRNTNKTASISKI